MMGALLETGLGRHSIDGLGRKTTTHQLKVALRKADKQQANVRKTKTWNSERTAFEQPQPQAVPKEKGVRNAIRRQTRKLKKTSPSRPTTAHDGKPPALYRSDSFDYGDEHKGRPTQVQFVPQAQPAPRPRVAQTEAQRQYLTLTAHQKQRRAEQKAAEKRIKQQEKAERRVLAQKVKQEKVLEYIRALTSRHPRQNLKRIRYGPVQEQHLAQQYYVSPPASYHHTSTSPESWRENVSNVSHDLVSPIGTPSPPISFYPQRYTPSLANDDDLHIHLRAVPPAAIPESETHELPTYERLSTTKREPQATICEAPTDLPNREVQMCKPKSNMVYCDICSATVSLSNAFFSCTICGPRDGGIVCSACHQENRKCFAGLHDLESSMEVVQRMSPVSTWKAHSSPKQVSTMSSKAFEGSDEAKALSRISVDMASQTLCLATLQKKITKMEAGIETQTKAMSHLSTSLTATIESQRELTADLTKSMRADRILNLHTIKRTSTKRKPRRPSLESSNRLVHLSQDISKEREMAVREREIALKERQIALQERQEAAKERREKTLPPPNPLPSQSLASAPVQENRILLNIQNKLDRIEELSAMNLRQAPNFNEKVVEQTVECSMARLTLVTAGIQEHASIKRKSDSIDTTNSMQSTPTTGLALGSFLQPPARTMSRGNKDDDEGDGHSPKRPKTQPTPVPESGRRLLLACPYSKMDFNRYSHRNPDELNYRGCSSCVLSDISRLKQHLYRVHQYPEHHCPRCYDDFPNKEKLNTHLRDGCQAKECPYPEKFQDSTKLKKKWPRKSMAECWYMVWKILFPNHRQPASPYAEDLNTGGGMVLPVPNTPPQRLPTFSISPDVLTDLVHQRLQQESITDPTQHALLFSLVSDVTNDALRMISASPTTMTNSNPSSAIPQSGTYATSPGPDSALMRRNVSDPNIPSAGAGTMDNTLGHFHNPQDLSSMGSGVSSETQVPEPLSAIVPAMSSNQSSGTFSDSSPFPGTENLMDFDDDLIQLSSAEIMAPIKPSNSTRTVDSGYDSFLPNDDLPRAYPFGGAGAGTSESSATGTENQSHDSLCDPELYERLRQEYGDDAFPPYGGNTKMDLGHGFGA
jgi:hypothetical protein